MNSLTCAYCGKVKKEVSFYIGASSLPSWTMHEGTGKISCPDCYALAQKEGQLKINQYVNSINNLKVKK